MRYWAYLCAKLALAAGLLYYPIAILNRAWKPEDVLMDGTRPGHFAYNLVFTLVVLLWFLGWSQFCFFLILDQRRRCRVCLRRLRMPVETGSWGSMLQFGRPRIESICPYGHGTLKEEELQISGLALPEWKEHSGDMWEDLCAAGKERDSQP